MRTSSLFRALVRKPCLWLTWALMASACSSSAARSPIEPPAPGPGVEPMPAVAAPSPSQTLLPLDATKAVMVSSTRSYTFATAGSLRLLGARASNAWFEHVEADGTRSVLTLTPSELLHEYALDPEPPPGFVEPVPATSPLFRKVVASFPATPLQLDAAVTEPGGLILIESRAARSSGRPLPPPAEQRFEPTRVYVFAETAEPYVDHPLSLPNLTVEHVAYGMDNEPVALVAVSVTGTVTLASTKDRAAPAGVSAKSGERMHALLRLDAGGTPDVLFGLPDVPADARVTLADRPGGSWLFARGGASGAGTWLGSLQQRAPNWLRAVGTGDHATEASARVHGPFSLGEGVVLAGELDGVDLGLGSWAAPGELVMLDALGNVQWARSTTGRVLSAAVVADRIELLTQDPASSDLQLHRIEPDGSVRARATLSLPPACAAGTPAQLVDLAIYGNAFGSFVLLECVEVESDERAATTHVHVLEVG